MRKKLMVTGKTTFTRADGSKEVHIHPPSEVQEKGQSMMMTFSQEPRAGAIAMGTSTPKCSACEKGYFKSGLPGVLAHVEGWRVIGRVQYCDVCNRFSTDSKAWNALQHKWDAERVRERRRKR